LATPSERFEIGLDVVIAEIEARLVTGADPRRRA
jgi:hypothetical protein